MFVHFPYKPFKKLPNFVLCFTIRGNPSLYLTSLSWKRLKASKAKRNDRNWSDRKYDPKMHSTIAGVYHFSFFSLPTPNLFEVWLKQISFNSRSYFYIILTFSLNHWSKGNAEWDVALLFILLSVMVPEAAQLLTMESRIQGENNEKRFAHEERMENIIAAVTVLRAPSWDAEGHSGFPLLSQLHVEPCKRGASAPTL